MVELIVLVTSVEFHEPTFESGSEYIVLEPSDGWPIEETIYEILCEQFGQQQQRK